MADGLADYWFQRPDRESQLPAIQVGLQMYQQRVRNELERKQLANQTAQTMLELQKGQALLDAKLKQEQGFTELNGLLAQTAKDEAWLNPDNQAKYWDVVSRYPQVLQGGMADRLFDSTFGAAQRSKERAAQLEGLNVYRQGQLAAQEERARLAAERNDLMEEMNAIRQIEILSGIDQSERLRVIQEKNLAARERETEMRLKGLELRLPASVKAELEAAKEKYKNQDYSRKPAENARLYDEERRRLLAPYEGQAPAVAPAPVATPAAPKAQFRFNPNTGKLEPVQ